MGARTVSVIVPVKDDPRIADCLASLEADRPPGIEAEVIVVDNGSAPEFSAWLEGIARGGGVTLLRVPEPGVYAARNRGVEAARGAAVFFADADCVVGPGWFAAGLAMLERGFDLVQGFSGALPGGRTAQLIQARYEARFRRLAAGSPTDTDTRNLAVRRGVFERLRFNEAYRRVGDTEFGLRAEAAGFRVGYAPAMRVEHAHDDDLRVFAAKQFCHGWGAQRLMTERPGLPWHGAQLRRWDRHGGRVRRLPGRRALSRALARGALAAAGALERGGERLPWPAASAAMLAIDKAALLAGHLAFEPGDPEPSPSGVLGRRLPRD
ncbi:glycosyltransferase [Tepidiforma sp.]|uniref:glycosyltransferase family 2 protein n=1 Tax=Tepidiforma sp. TaxID=2682230 RepID=UPI0026043252|nr:glycosyltransferase [Tepidiforma sp.]MCX7618372.1 glycosyltransferase [Tepidiforma sp.]